MNTFCECTDYHHVPSTPSFSRPDPAAALVPDIRCPNGPDMDYKSEPVVPSTPICPLLRGVYSTNLREISADSRCSYVHVGWGLKGGRQMPDLELCCSLYTKSTYTSYQD